MNNDENKNNVENQQQATQEPAKQEPKNEPENGNQDVDISTKEALAALKKNAKAKAKDIWEKAKPKLKTIAVIGAIGATGAYIYSEMTKPELSNSDLKALEPTPLDIPPTEYQIMGQAMAPAVQEPVAPAMEQTDLGTDDVVNL